MDRVKCLRFRRRIKHCKSPGKIAFREYGNLIKNELPLKAQLAGDSVWVVQGTNPENSDGGTVYMELMTGD